jgi:hypothetical protein
MSTDLAQLRELLTLPPGVTAARWIVERLGPDGDSFLPGPTDYQLLALLRPAGVLGPAEGERSLALSAEAAQALLGESAALTVRGRAFDAASLSSSRFRAALALRAGDGVLVSAVSA